MNQLSSREDKGREGKSEKAYSSPSFSTLNNPHLVPTSISLRSSTRLTMVAPVARAIRLLSDLRTRLIAVMLFLTR